MGTLKKENTIPALPDQDKKASLLEISKASEFFAPALNIPGSVAGIQESLFISRKRSKGSFVLVRALSFSCYSVNHFVAIEGQVQQMEVRYINNSYELDQIKRTKKLCSEGLYVELQAVFIGEYERFERVSKRHLSRALWSGKKG